MSEIRIKNLTKDYGNNKGVFDLSFEINKGEVFGFIGPNGAGKTTTIRQLMGFTHPDKGECYIKDMDCSKESARIKEYLGYLPGEIAFMDEMTGHEFIHFMASMRNQTDLTYAKKLIDMFEYDPSGKIKKMSKGMKQKLGIVCAFMHDPDILILDEPTSGLDPLMQNRFVDLILMEKKKGKTILMSSHIFEEVEKTCDRVGIIKNGHLMTVDSIYDLKERKQKKYLVTFKHKEEAENAAKDRNDVEYISENQVMFIVKGNIDSLIKCLANYTVISLQEEEQSLEQVFMHYYGGEKNV